MTIADIMSTRVVTVGPDQDLLAVRNLFAAHRFHHLLVVEQGRLVGVISDRDLLRAMSPFVDTLAERPQDLATLRRKVHQIMSRNLVVAKRSDSAKDAAASMLAHAVSCLPVVTHDGRIEGIVSWKDLLRSLHGKLT
ncbi:MAG: CBS domain-containing protein [Polyangiaceae bacterium]|jgi:acetoin utilization protein AcuB